MHHGVDVRDERVAGADGADHGVVHGFALLAEVVDLARAVGAVAAHHGREGAELHPAGIELGEGDVAAAVRIVPEEEPADVGVPVRETDEPHVQAARDLVLQGIPAGDGVAGPCVRAESLLPGVGAAREDEDAVSVGMIRPLVLVDAAGGHEGIQVADAAERALFGQEVEIGVLDVVVVGLGGVHPPGVGSVVEELGGVAPVDVAGFPAVGIVGTRTAGAADRRVVRPGVDVQDMAFFLQHLVLLGLLPEVRPDHEHGVGVQFMYAVEHLLRLGEAGVQELHGVPVVVVLAPVLPVLDDAVEGDTLHRRWEEQQPFQPQSQQMH